MSAPSVIGALRRFLPEYLSTNPVLAPGQWRAVHAILHCRTPAMGGHVHHCADCGEQHFAWHSCNHKACPQCGAEATARWVERQLERRVNAPHFLVTFTLPQELREIFLGSLAKDAIDLLFHAVDTALKRTLSSRKSLGAENCGFLSVLHTWNQQILFHPHIHCMVPGAGLDARGGLVKVKSPLFLAPLPILRANFRRAFRGEMDRLGWRVDPSVWRKDWGVHIQPCGDGKSAVKYLGAYVAKTAIGDSRIPAVGHDTVTFRWKDRSKGGVTKVATIGGVEFARRYLRHALPRGTRSIRYHGFFHPSSVKKRERVLFLSGRPLFTGSKAPAPARPSRPGWLCPCCGKAMPALARIPRGERETSHAPTRGPPPECAA